MRYRASPLGLLFDRLYNTVRRLRLIAWQPVLAYLAGPLLSLSCDFVFERLAENCDSLRAQLRVMFRRSVRVVYLNKLNWRYGP